MHMDVVIFGGGAAGLWLLEALTRAGYRAVLLEAGELGRGQTIASQGIIHGGLKYMLSGLFTQAAGQIREMPVIWRECLAGNRAPDLRRTLVRSDFCWLWQTQATRSRFGMLAARLFLRARPTVLTEGERPAVLARCPGTVARLDEQVISPASLLEDLSSQHAGRVLRIDAAYGLKLTSPAPGMVDCIHLKNPATRDELQIRPRQVVFTAGAGNAKLRLMAGLAEQAMQRRPLHMVLARGELPLFNGHCIDGAKTRVTITSDIDSAGQTIWQIGGQVAEGGVQFNEPTLIQHAQSELQAVMPAVDFSRVEWTTYRVDRAERLVRSGVRPNAAQVLHEGNVITAWPTKLALVPQLVQKVVDCLRAGEWEPAGEPAFIPNWPCPSVALPPWETLQSWQSNQVPVLS